jgi:hypothetical protein
MKILFEFYMDGYNSEAEMKKAAIEYIDDQLNSAGTSVKILWMEDVKEKTHES